MRLPLGLLLFASLAMLLWTADFFLAPQVDLAVTVIAVQIDPEVVQTADTRYGTAHLVLSDRMTVTVRLPDGAMHSEPPAFQSEELRMLELFNYRLSVCSKFLRRM